MSQYLNIYFKIGDKYLQAGHFSRSSKIYELLANVVPYENLINLSTRQINDFMNKMEEKIKSIKKSYDLKEQEIATISNFNNTVDEKISTINFIREALADLQEELEECTYFADVLLYWYDITALAAWEDKDADTIIWGGIDAYPEE